MEEFLLTEKTVESVFLDLGELTRVYNSDRELTVSLWRALRTDVKTGGPLYPDFYRREIRAGKFRQPDVTVREIGEVECVVPKASSSSRMTTTSGSGRRITRSFQTGRCLSPNSEGCWISWRAMRSE